MLIALLAALAAAPDPAPEFLNDGRATITEWRKQMVWGSFGRHPARNIFDLAEAAFGERENPYALGTMVSHDREVQSGVALARAYAGAELGEGSRPISLEFLSRMVGYKPKSEAEGQRAVDRVNEIFRDLHKGNAFVTTSDVAFDIPARGRQTCEARWGVWGGDEKWLKSMGAPVDEMKRWKVTPAELRFLRDHRSNSVWGDEKEERVVGYRFKALHILEYPERDSLRERWLGAIVLGRDGIVVRAFANPLVVARFPATRTEKELKAEEAADAVRLKALDRAAR